MSKGLTASHTIVRRSLVKPVGLDIGPIRAMRIEEPDPNTRVVGAYRHPADRGWIGVDPDGKLIICLQTPEGIAHYRIQPEKIWNSFCAAIDRSDYVVPAHDQAIDYR
jgi:hypothetical protein